MKKLEQMAVDWIRSQIGTGEGFIVNHSDTHVEDGAKAAYIAGFKAAREMALQCVLNGERIPNEYYTADIEAAILKLGEEEVK